MRALVDRVVRSLRVRGSRVAIERSQKRIAAEKRQREIHQQQREYMQAASTMMAQALRTHDSTRARVEFSRTQAIRKDYLEPSGVLALKASAVQERARRAHEQLLDYLGPHFYEEVEEFKAMRAHANPELAKFLDYIT